MHHRQSRKGTKEGRKGTEHTQREGAGAHHLHPVDTMKHTTKGAHDTARQYHISKICLDFALSCLRKSR